MNVQRFKTGKTEITAAEENSGIIGGASNPDTCLDEAKYSHQRTPIEGTVAGTVAQSHKESNAQQSQEQ